MQTTKFPKEQLHRIRFTKRTEQQIAAKLSGAAAGPACASGFSDALTGKSLNIQTDGGPALRYTFRSRNRLILAEGSAAAVSCGYGALTLGQIALFSHWVPGTQRGYQR